MMKKKIFFFDIDGTLVDSKTHNVPESTKQALQELKTQGHHLCIATGRSLQSVIDGDFDKLIDWDMYLCNNGQAIYSHDYKLVHITPIPTKAVYECIQKAESLDAPLLIMGEKDVLTKKANQYVLTSLEFFKEALPEVGTYKETPVVMMIAYGPNGYDYQDYKDIDELDIIPGQSTYADIVLKGYHKAMGIQSVEKYFPDIESIAFGDSLNDIDMLKHVNIGIAMGNAHEDLKDVADMITEDVVNNGIYHALKKLQIL